MTTTEPTKARPRTTGQALESLVAGVGVVWVLIGFFYYVWTPHLASSQIETWVLVQLVLGVTSLVLSVRNRR